MLGELMRRVPTIRAAGEPDRLLSSFINGIKHLPLRPRLSRYRPLSRSRRAPQGTRCRI
jgi:hypothetical protein